MISDAEREAAAAAVQLGEQVAQQYWQAAAQTPGTGLAVALPSWPDAQGRRPQGLGFGDDVPAEALRQPERPRLVPDYGASPIVGGQLHHSMGSGASAGLDGVSWPAGQTQPSSAARSSMQYVPASTQTWRARLAEAWRTLTGR